MIITLSKMQLKRAKDVGIKRQQYNDSIGKRDAHGFRGDGAMIHIQGATAELAVSIALGERQADFVTKAFQWKVPHFSIPCGVRPLQSREGEKPGWAHEGKIVFGYVGNMGEAHSELFVERVAKQLDPERHVFVVSMYGKKAATLESRLRNYPVVIFCTGIEQAHMSWIDVHLVSLLDNWVHICVPSKAVSAVTSGTSILYCGPAQSDNWLMLQKAGWKLDTSADDQALSDLINGINSASLEEKKGEAVHLSEKLARQQKEAYAAIAQWLITAG